MNFPKLYQNRNNLLPSRLVYKDQGGSATSLYGVSLNKTMKTATDGQIIQKVAGEWTNVAATTAGLVYKGTWAASTNTPTLADGGGTAGNYYIASDDGSVDFGSGAISFTAGDWAIYSSSGVWQKLDNTDNVASVFGRVGAVVAVAGDYTAAQVGAVAITGDETVAGVKTFSSFPVTPSSAPTTNYQTANKKYVDDSAGGGGISLYTATVDGTGGTGDYTTVNAAYAAGNTAIDVIGDTTETASTVLTTNLSLRVRPSVTLNMDDYQITSSSATDIWIDLYGEIDYSYTSGTNTPLFQLPNNSNFYIEGYSSGVFDNNSATGCYLINAGLHTNTNVRIKNITIDLPSTSNLGINVSAFSESYAENIKIISGGASCRYCLNGFRKVDGLFLKGSFSASVPAISDVQNITNVWTENGSTAIILIDSHGAISNFGSVGSGVLHIQLTSGHSCAVSNGYLNATGSIDVGSYDNHKIVNVNGGILDLSNAGANNNQISNCDFDSLTSNIINGDDNMLSNVKVIAGFAVDGDRNNLNGIRVGTTGGADTITFNAGATNNIAVGCTTDAIIVDNGTTNIAPATANIIV